ncbi:MAG: hypothetical protein KKG33_06740 [candidate division Zixibacteria bacterium]|nr:hypothetical protein [candidate division Zixibacteria bacterium]
MNIDFAVDTFTVAGGSVRLDLDSMGTAPDTGSIVTIILDSIVSPKVAYTYQIAVSAVDSTGMLIAGPTLTQVFQIFPDSLDSIAISPSEPAPVTAGNSIAFTCGRWDQYSNTLIDPVPVWSISGIPEGNTPNGRISEEGVFTGKYAGSSRIFCEVDSLVDSVTVDVVNSVFHHFIVSGFPDSTTAGRPLADSIIVEARDLYGNLVLDFDGAIWFVTTDTAADVAPGSMSPFTISEFDSGRVAFPGSDFTFKTAGLHQIYLTDGGVNSEVFTILVKPGEVARFSLSTQTSVTAGELFAIQVDSVADSVGNVLDKFVTVELLSAGVSPGGDKPVVASFLASDGSGSGDQILVCAEITQFRITVGSLEKFTGDITVSPAAAEEFSVLIASPQIVGIPFDSPATITVLDEFGNIAVDFDASTDNVTLSPDGTGTVIPSVLDEASSFIDGVCDLTQFAVMYEGQARFLTFSAESNSGVTGTSNTVEINSSSIEGLFVNPTELFKGDTLIASVTIANFGSLPAVINTITLSSSQGGVGIISVSPPLPDNIAGNSSLTYELKSIIPEDFDPGWTRFRSSFRGLYNLQPITDTSAYLDSVRILTQQNLVYSESSLSPTVVTKGESYAFTCDVEHFGAENITLNTGSFIRFISEDADTFRSKLAIPIYVIAPTVQPVTLFFQESTIDSGFASGQYDVELQLIGQQGSSNYSDQIVLTDSITIQTPSSLQFEEESFEPSTAFRGTSIQPTLRVLNNGEAELELDLEQSVLRLTSGDDEIRFSLFESDSVMAPGTNVLHFNAKSVPSSFPLDTNSLTLDLSGIENGHPNSASLNLGEDLIDFLQQATVQMNSVTAVSANTPNINTQQEFDVVVKVSNEAEEDLSEVWIEMLTDGTSSFEDSLSLDILPLGEADSVTFHVTASTEPNPAELFIARIRSATGVVTGQKAMVLSPIDNTAAVSIQTPASISLSARIDAPMTAVDGILSYGQGFHIIAGFENHGQASAGYGIVSLSLRNAAGFETSDEPLIAFSIDDVVGWNVATPRTEGNFEIIIELTDIPIDSNTGLPSDVGIGADTISVTVQQEELKLRVEYDAFPGHLLSPGDQFMPVTLNISAVAENPESEIRINSLLLGLLDRYDGSIASNNLLVGASVHYGISQTAGSLAGNQVQFAFDDGLIVRAGQAADISVSFTLSSAYSGSNFFIEMDSSSMSATDITFGIEGADVPITGIGDTPFYFKAGFGMVPRELESSFFNYPNPFAAGNESTNIVYYLAGPSDITLEIFTLIGELVFSEEIASGSAGAVAGRNVLIWDGSNSRGETVNNGVYIAVLKVASGGDARTKIAVVK